MATTTAPERVIRYVETLEGRETGNEGASGTSRERTGVAPCPAAVAGPTLAGEATTFALVELLLKDQPRLSALTRRPEVQREVIPRLLAIGLVGYIVFAVVLCVVFQCAEVWPRLTPLAAWLDSPREPLLRIARLAPTEYWAVWLDGLALHLTAAFVTGLTGSIGVCLPSFHFYSLLAGIRTSMLQVTTSALVGLASGAVAVLGALPIYLAVVLGLVVFGRPAWAIDFVCLVGLVLPFLAGLYGTRSLYLGFLALTDTLAEERRCRRTCFLRRLLVAWCGCYTAVTPVMIYALWEYFGR
jgi:hypothetical protein